MSDAFEGVSPLRSADVPCCHLQSREQRSNRFLASSALLQLHSADGIDARHEQLAMYKFCETVHMANTLVQLSKTPIRKCLTGMQERQEVAETLATLHTQDRLLCEDAHVGYCVRHR